MITNIFFPEIHGIFGFGCMRFPMTPEKEVDIPQTKEMVDIFLENGFNYFDTAHGYIGGKSETALKECLTSRYPREMYLLTNQLTATYFEKEEDIRPLFEAQLEACGVEYFDFFLMHAQNAKNFVKYKECRAYETAFALRDEGKVRHVGLSFHDTPEVLDSILTEYPQVEAVQLQFNYADYEDPGVQSRRCYEVCVKHGKPVIVMEPVKGGNLLDLPEGPQSVLDSFRAEKGAGGSNASYAVRFAASFPNVFMVLSGMSDIAQMNDNVATMRDFVPFDEEEFAMIGRVRAAIEELIVIKCTSCRYCVTENQCPMSIDIPEFFDIYNAKKAFNNPRSARFYEFLASKGGKPSDCLKCQMCEQVCPQHLPISELMELVAAEFEG
ncbi:MAG: aldo/keto reductase [Clostridia bacterium]|nr:aldo/keto reductase [Clostridia bacterium]